MIKKKKKKNNIKEYLIQHLVELSILFIIWFILFLLPSKNEVYIFITFYFLEYFLYIAYISLLFYVLFLFRSKYKKYLLIFFIIWFILFIYSFTISKYKWKDSIDVLFFWEYNIDYKAWKKIFNAIKTSRISKEITNNDSDISYLDISFNNEVFHDFILSKEERLLSYLTKKKFYKYDFIIWLENDGEKSEVFIYSVYERVLLKNNLSLLKLTWINDDIKVKVLDVLSSIHYSLSWKIHNNEKIIINLNYWKKLKEKLLNWKYISWIDKNKVNNLLNLLNTEYYYKIAFLFYWLNQIDKTYEYLLKAIKTSPILFSDNEDDFYEKENLYINLGLLTQWNFYEDYLKYGIKDKKDKNIFLAEHNNNEPIYVLYYSIIDDFHLWYWDKVLDIINEIESYNLDENNPIINYILWKIYLNISWLRTDFFQWDKDLLSFVNNTGNSSILLHEKGVEFLKKVNINKEHIYYLKYKIAFHEYVLRLFKEWKWVSIEEFSKLRRKHIDKYVESVNFDKLDIGLGKKEDIDALKMMIWNENISDVNPFY